MRLSLIGMAGSGKSTWSSKLAEHGFRRYCCDDLISAKLAPELTRADGSTMQMGEWMGFPFEPYYDEHESKYLSHETEVLVEIFEHLADLKNRTESNTVIDTTGSVIYTGEVPLKKLKKCTTVVHLSTPPEVQEHLLKAYLANPHPMLWRGTFSQGPHESTGQALARCYPKLFMARKTLYEQYADVTIDFYRRSKEGFEVDDFLREIEQGHVHH